jgi:hypothetical protein
MTTKHFEQEGALLFHYVIASADMYYAEEGQCDVLLGSDKDGRIHIWGQTDKADPSTRIELCQVFLEYGLYCSAWCTAIEAHCLMQNFGERLGHALAKYLQDSPALFASDNPALYALEQVFESIGVRYSVESLAGGVRFLVTQCPVENAAHRSGMSHVELARYGINALCRSLVSDINPHLIVETSPENLPEFMFTMMEADATCR